MLLGFKTESLLNNQQRTALAKHCGVAPESLELGTGFNQTDTRP